jgi:hypothetical protein
MAQQERVGVALLIDEAQALPIGDLYTVFRVVNHLDWLPISAIMAGLPNIPHSLSGKVPMSIVDVYFKDLDPLTPEGSRAALTAPVFDAGGEFEVDALDSLIGFAAGHPLTLQRLGFSAWSHADLDAPSDAPPRLQNHHASAAIDETRSQLEVSIYRPVWAQCDKARRAVLSALASSEESLSEYELLLGLKPAVKNPEKALGDLLGQGIVYMHEDAVRFVVPGFDGFVRTRSPT